MPWTCPGSSPRIAYLVFAVGLSACGTDAVYGPIGDVPIVLDATDTGAPDGPDAPDDDADRDVDVDGDADADPDGDVDVDDVDAADADADLPDADVSPGCGDGVVDEGEECDDGPDNSDELPDRCRTTCLAPACGDGVIDGDEVCDDGNTEHDDGCRADCLGPVCGDSVVEGTEECDDGNTDAGDGCDGACLVERPPGCGDGTVGEGEECDDGNAVHDDDCTNLCRLPFCGDQVVQVSYGEQCDDGNLVADDGCTNRCRLPACGDGVLHRGEECDNGDANSDAIADACRTDCTLPRCGDAVTDRTEECDDGNTDPTDGCTNRCGLPACGDGIVHAGEECDRGTANSDTAPDACRTSCVAAACGDGVVDTGEPCDDGDRDDVDECSNACVLPVCGDGVRNGTEQCDDGNAIQTDGCTNRCLLPACGDGIVHAGEECDAGTANSDTRPDACRLDCVSPRCGDTVVDTGEQCDDGDRDDIDECSNACLLPVCGDGVRNGSEQCDDGNTTSGDCCDAVCSREVTLACDPCDGACAADEICDDGACVCACPGGCDTGTCWVLDGGGPAAADITLVSGPPAADITFSIDTTGSMGGEITALRSTLTSQIIPRAREAFARPGFGVSTFDDFPCDSHGSGSDVPFALRHRVSTDAASVQAAVNAIPLHYGADSFESGYEALYQVATGAGVVGCNATVSPFNPAAGYVAGVADGTIGGVGFRAGALPVVVHVTDAPSHEGTVYGSFAATSTEAIGALNGIGARFIGIASGSDARSYLLNVATRTGSRVPVCSWDGARPSGCGAGTCCTGLNGAGRAPEGGLCPLVFDIDSSGSGLGSSVVSGIEALAQVVPYDASLAVVPDPVSLAAGFDTSCLVSSAAIVDVGAASGACEASPSLEDTDGDGRGDAITGLVGGVDIGVELELDPSCAVGSGTHRVTIALVTAHGVVVAEWPFEVVVR